MENASKALLIAGAVLIAILLISVGIMIYSGSSGIFKKGGAAISEAEISAFNSEFKAYEGKISGSQLKELIGKINSNNGDSEKTVIAIYYHTAELNLNGKNITGATTVKGYDDNNIKVQTYSEDAVKNLKSYTITMYDFSKDGLIDSVGINRKLP